MAALIPLPLTLQQYQRFYHPRIVLPPTLFIITEDEEVTNTYTLLPLELPDEDRFPRPPQPQLPKQALYRSRRIR